MSMKTIAEMTGLSITTVSHALNGTRAVSKHSRALVEQAAAQIGYKPNLAAQMLKTNRSHIIALVMPSTEPGNSTNSFFFEVLNGARSALEQHGYDLMVATYSEEQSKKNLADLQLLQKRLVDGILLVPFGNDPASLDAIRSLGIPLVLVDRRMDGAALPNVYSDNVEGARRAVHLLAEHGRRRMALLCGSNDSSTYHDRRRGFCTALRELNLPCEEQNILRNLPYRVESGYRAAGRLLENGIDAVFAANNVLLMGVLQWFNEHGVRVPDDIAVVGFDDYDWMRVTNPPITTTYQNPGLMGIRAAELLLQLLDGQAVPAKPLVLPCELVLRKSHG